MEQSTILEVSAYEAHSAQSLFGDFILCQRMSVYVESFARMRFLVQQHIHTRGLVAIIHMISP